MNPLPRDSLCDVNSNTIGLPDESRPAQATDGTIFITNFWRWSSASTEEGTPYDNMAYGLLWPIFSVTGGPRSTPPSNARHV